MLFHDKIFLFAFLPLVLLGFFLLKDKYRFIFLIISGYVFYAAWNLKFSPLIIFSILINYLFSKEIIKRDDKDKKTVLISAIIFNILYLGFFKYSDFFINNINLLFNSNIEPLNLPFPLALSFVTFQTIAFLCDCYENNIKNLNLKRYALFIIFFPQLIAGPIVRYNQMISQFEEGKNLNFIFKNICIGLIILSIGIIKKVFIADNLSIVTDQVFTDTTSLSFVDCWLGSLCFTFQIYFDFSGYIDMATGIALLFNIRLPQNFDSPFKATGMINFWQRWHITLTHFLTTYLYGPLLKSFRNINFLNSMVATLIVFLIAGLWHGPSWTYVIFGAMHGFGLIVNHTFKRIFDIKLNQFFSQTLTFAYVNFTFIFFRAESVDQASFIIKKMLDFRSINKLEYISIDLTTAVITAFIFSIIICFVLKNTNWLIGKLSLNKLLD